MSGQSFGNQLPNQALNLLQRQNVNQQFGLNRQPPSLLNQQVPGVQQAPMQQPVQQQPGFYKSGFNPSSALDSLGNPLTPLRSPELPFYETGVGRVFPGGMGGGISQPGFSGTQPTFAPAGGAQQPAPIAMPVRGRR